MFQFNIYFVLLYYYFNYLYVYIYISEWHNLKKCNIVSFKYTQLCIYIHNVKLNIDNDI